MTEWSKEKFEKRRRNSKKPKMILNCTIEALSLLALEPMTLQCEVHMLIGCICMIFLVPIAVMFLILSNFQSEHPPYYGAVDENQNLIVEDFVRIIDVYEDIGIPVTIESPSWLEDVVENHMLTLNNN